MKISKEEFSVLKEEVQKWDTEGNRQMYREGKFVNSALTKDLNKRYRWDIFWALSESTRPAPGKYLDSHISTALRKVIPNII